MFGAVAIFFAFLSTLANGQISPCTESYSHWATLRNATIKIYWKFNDTDITFEVHGQTTGWIGIGFSPNGAMTGSDIFIGWVKDGKVKVTDRHATENRLPPLDTEQNVDVLGGMECDGWTMFKFTRQLAACEAEYDREITQDTQRLIYAWGDSDPTGDDVTVKNYHGTTNRGTESMFFLQSSDIPTGLPEGPTYHTIDLLMDNFEIPAVDTYYNCKLFKLPDLTKKHHIVKMEAIVQPGNELNVHHIVVYRCGDVLQNQTELGLEARCYSPNMAHFETCVGELGAWAIGGEAFYYPEEVGFSIGLDGDPVYILLEMHYDNPNVKSGIIDSSGIRFTYTDTIRQYDMGVLEVGLRTGGGELIIPPDAKEFLVAGHCSPFCLGERMADSNVDSVTVFAVGLHSHLAGRALRLRHIKEDGVELPYLASDQTYDFNYQEGRFVNPPNGTILKSTDRLIMECVYNTEGRKEVTEGGLGTRDEMCVAFVSYYPKIDLAYCWSSVPAEVTWPFFEIDVDNVKPHPLKVNEEDATLSDFSLTAPPDYAGVTVKEYLDNVPWTSDLTTLFNEYYNTAIQYELCIPQKENYTIQDFNITEVKVPLVEQRKECTKPQSPLRQVVDTQECPVAGTTGPTTTSDSLIPKVEIFLLTCALYIFYHGSS